MLINDFVNPLEKHGPDRIRRPYVFTYLIFPYFV